MKMTRLTKNYFIRLIIDNLPLVVAILTYPFVILISVIYLLVKLLKPQTKHESIKGQVAVITGSARGLGREIATELAKRGCHIAIVDVQRSLAEETAATLAQLYSVKTKAYQVDVTNYQQLQELEAKVNIDLGTPTILINNAGILMFSCAENPPPEEISRMINVNLTAVCYATQIFLPKMKELNRGHIVNISSLSALMCFPNVSIYGSTKLAIRQFTSMLRMELMYLKHNITATTVMPTFLNTNESVKQLASLDWVIGNLSMSDTDKVVEQIVDGMLLGADELIIPASMEYVYKLFEILPTYVREKIYAVLGERSYKKFIKSTKVNTILKKEIQLIENSFRDLNNTKCK